MKLKVDDPLIVYKRGTAYYQKGDYKRCIIDLLNTLELSPSQTYLAEVYYHLGKIMIK